MKFKLNWINHFVDLSDKTPAEIYDALNSMGLEVEDFRKIGYGTNLVSAQVIKKEKHPDADKLNLCQVDLGNQIVQIVCGAHNFKEGDKVIVSKPGAILPGNFKIKESEIRGQKSMGMICSLKELGYPESILSKEDKSGIYVVEDNSIDLGKEDVLKALKLNDYIIEIAITPNRADWHSLYEIARELAVYFNKPLKDLEVTTLDFSKDENIIVK